ncbi:MAG: response regulator [Phenylobacterium sp.]|jgi:DNA-binding response OmpR family regulator|nr:response regulator [Phenylobacterium sp.]
MTNVLLVEDEREVADLVQDALADAGFEVTVAYNDDEAYQRLAAEGRSFTVLVADINLGSGTTGFDVARRARQLNSDLKVVYITGQAAHLSRFGVDDALMFPKPFDPRELADQVSLLVAGVG